MAGIYVYSDNTEVSGELVSMARKSGQEVCAITMSDADAAAVAEFGPDTIFVLKGQNSLPESYAGAMAKLLTDQNASAFFVSATVRGRDIAAQVASRIGCGLVSEAGNISFNGNTITASRFMYGGLTEQVEECGSQTVFTAPRRRASGST